MTGAQDRPRRSVLGFFGLETGEKAWEVLLWTAPYLLLLGGGLVGLSFAVHWFFPLPVLLHVAAIVLAVAYFFLFLARVRRVADTADNAQDSPARQDTEPTERP